MKPSPLNSILMSGDYDIGMKRRISRIALAAALAAISLPALAAPYVTLSDYAALPGSSIGIFGYGFEPNGQIRVSVAGVSITGAADESGVFKATTTVPWTDEGNYKVSANGAMTAARLYVAGHYPTVKPTSYYVLPGRSWGLSGSGFAPGEEIALMDGSVSVATFAADRFGAFSDPAVFVVPWSYASSTKTYKLATTKSSYDIPFTIKFGTYYPQFEPSTYYAAAGSAIGIGGRDFAPNEPVYVYVAGELVSTVTSNAAGGFSATVTAPPTSAKTFDIVAQGAWSKTYATRTITVAR